MVEVLSPGGEARDVRTKRDDYERFGVGEYWIIDPRARSFLFLCLTPQGRYAQAAPSGDRFESGAVEGFVLDTAAVRSAMEG